MPEFLHYNCYIAKMGKEGVSGSKRVSDQGKSDACKKLAGTCQSGL